MRRLLTWATAAVLPALVLGALSAGCSGDKGGDSSTGKTESKKEPKGKGQKREELASTGWTTVKGRVTLDGDKPNVEEMTKELLAKIDANQDKKHCVDGATDDEKSEQTWRFGKNNGV